MGYIGKVTAGGGTHLIGSTLYGTCATPAATSSKVVSCANFDVLLEGVTIHVKFENSNTAENPTLDVNNTGERNIYRYGTTAPSATDGTSWSAGSVVSFTFDGQYWQMNDWQNTIYEFDSGKLNKTSVPNVTSAGTVPSLTITEVPFNGVTSFTSGSMPTLQVERKTCTRINSYTANIPTSATVVNGVFTVSLGVAVDMDKENVTFDAVDDWSDGETPTLRTESLIVGSASNWSAGTPTVLGTDIVVATGEISANGTGDSVITTVH